MKGIYNKVVELLIPILENKCDSNFVSKIEGNFSSNLILDESIDSKKLDKKYNITIFEEDNIIPDNEKILSKRKIIDNSKSNLFVYLKKVGNSRRVQSRDSYTGSSSSLFITVKINKREVKYVISKIDLNSNSRKRSNGDIDSNSNSITNFVRNKRPRCYSEAFLQNDEKSEDKKLDFDKLVSATKTRNYILDDGVLDFLDYYSRNPKKHSLTFNEIVGMESGYNTRSRNDSNLIQKMNYGSETLGDMIKEEGVKYEKKVIEELINKIKDYNKDNKKSIKMVTIDTSPDILNNFEYTKRLIKNGVEILYQPVLLNESDDTFGCPDLLVRSDILNDFFGSKYLEIDTNSIDINIGFTYIVIDIKHSHLDFNSDEKTLRNTETIKPYKSQLCIYNNALSKIQNYDHKMALVLGKSYTIKGIKSYDYMNKLGIIDYAERDKDYILKTADAVNWIRRVREDGKYWVLDPIPSVKELFPRMNNEKDGKWKDIKQKISENIGEITSVYYCGIKERKMAHTNSVYSWRDENCDSTTLGFSPNSNSKIPKTIDKILNINRSEDIKVLPNRILTEKVESFSWRDCQNNAVEFYLDFETMNSNFTELNGSISYDSVFVFQVGVGHIDFDGNWVYKSFISNNRSKEGEKILFDNFFKHINEVVSSHGVGSNYHFVHWYPHEKICYDKLRAKLNLPNIRFMDLSRLFREEPIVVKGSLRFKLKSISKALFNMGLIKTSWDLSSECNSGLAAMALANKLYSEAEINNEEVKEENKFMKEIIKYNEIDCKVLWEILVYLRENH